jgi:carbonic anhydrase/acetyltransferase-like protein (isoleucine patch superfamily)
MLARLQAKIAVGHKLSVQNSMQIFKLGEQIPEFASDEWYVAPGAIVLGAVTMGHQANVWFNAVLRGDNDRIILGERCNVQDGSVFHTDRGLPLTLGREVCVGHAVNLHSCTIGDNCLIGIGSTVLNRVVLGRNCIVAANALVPEGKTFPDRVMLMGAPAKVAREVTDAEVEWIARIAESYVRRAARYRAELQPYRPPGLSTRTA